MRYEDTVTLPGVLTLEQLESIEEMIRGYGMVERHGLVLKFSVDTSDLTVPEGYGAWPGIAAEAWYLRELMEEIQLEMSACGVAYNVQADLVTP